MTDLAKEIWQTMSANRLRTALTGFSVAWGIFVLILLIGLSKALGDHNAEFAAKNDPNRISLWGGMTSLPWKGLDVGRDIYFHQRNFRNLADVDKVHIADVSTTVRFSGDLSYGDVTVSSVSAQGVKPAFFSKLFTMKSGRIINQVDINEKRKVVVLSRRHAEQLFDAGESPLGKMVKIGNSPYTVVGVYEHSYYDNPFVPLSTAMAVTGFSDATWNMDVNLKDVPSIEASKVVEKKVVERLSEQEKFDPKDESAVWVQNRMEQQERNAEGNKIMDYVMWSIGILSLLTGIIGVSNIMFVSVKERTHEIGVRRAIGAKPRKILMQVVTESVALTTVFGYVGIVMGTAASLIFAHYLDGTDYAMMSPKVDLTIAVEVTSALIVAGALAGIFPAIRATKVNPVEALRDE